MLEHSSRMLQADRSPDVNSYVDDLARQMLEVCAKYGVGHWSRLGPLVLNGSMPMEDVALVKKLRLEMREAMRDNRVPAVGPEWNRWRAEASVLEATKIMGDRKVLGPEAVAKMLGLSLETLEYPPVPFSRPELERARELGHSLVLRVSRASDGSPLSMLRISDVLAPRFEERGLINPLRHNNRHDRSDFYVVEAPAQGWAIVSTGIIPSTTSMNFLEQTEKLVQYLREETFRGIGLPQKYIGAIEQFEAAKDGIARVMETNWNNPGRPNPARMLLDLEITSLLRPTPVEAMYDAMLAYGQFGDLPLTDVKTWTSRGITQSPEDIVCFGEFDDWIPILGVRPESSTPKIGSVIALR